MDKVKKREDKSDLNAYYIYSILTREMNTSELLTTFNVCNMKLSGATKSICQMNKFVDRARGFIKIQKAIQCIEFYIRIYDSLHKNNRGTLENNLDTAIQLIQIFAKFRRRDLIIVDKLLDDGISLDSDCDEIIDNRCDLLAVYHNKQQEKLYLQRENKQGNNKQNI